MQDFFHFYHLCQPFFLNQIEGRTNPGSLKNFKDNFSREDVVFFSSGCVAYWRPLTEAFKHSVADSTSGTTWDFGVLDWTLDTILPLIFLH